MPPRTMRYPGLPPESPLNPRLPAAILSVALAATAVLWGSHPQPRALPAAQPSTELDLPPPPPPEPRPPPPRGALQGLVVYLSAGHGWVVHNLGSGWQRPRSKGMIEDEWTNELVGAQLAPALERAGATVLAVRERDVHAEAVLLGPTDAVITGEHGWVTPAPDHPLHLPCALLEAGAEARWTAAAPGEGRWHLYTRWPAASDRDPASTWEVRVGEQVATWEVDQRHHGGEWWPLGSWDLAAGEQVEVRLRPSDRGLAAAGEVRLGGGSLVATDPRYRRREVRRAWDLSAVHHLEALGAPRRVWAAEGSGFRGDASTRARWAAWSHPEGEEAVYLSVHTDANGGRGSAAMVRLPVTPDAPERVGASWTLAEAVLGDMVAAVREGPAPWWRDRGVDVEDLAELNEELQPEIPAVLLEVGFHDRTDEVEQLQSEAFQEALADGVVAGLARWRGGEPPPPRPALVLDGDRVSWRPGEGAPWGPGGHWEVRSRRQGRWGPWELAWEGSVDLEADVTDLQVVSVGIGGRSRPATASR